MLTAPLHLRDASILVVDDQPANVSLLEETLKQAGYTNVTSTMVSGEVCALHRKNRYDLILLDLQMPGMDGFQVMEGLKAGFFRYLTKPIKVNQFMDSLDVALKFSQAEKEQA